MIAVALSEAHEVQRFGGKAVQLGAALRAGLPVPNGIALDTAFVDAVAKGEATLWPSSKLCARRLRAHSPSGHQPSGKIRRVQASRDSRHRAQCARTSRRPRGSGRSLAFRSCQVGPCLRERVGADIDVRVGIVLRNSWTRMSRVSCSPVIR